MSEERFEHLMRDAAATYRRPPEVPLDEMWSVIEAEAFAGNGEGTTGNGDAVTRRPAPGTRRLWGHEWMRMAAVLVLGVAVGRFSTRAPDVSTPAGDQVAAAQDSASAVRGTYNSVTDQYLGQAAALLISLPQELRAERVDTTLITRADYLLMQSRLLLDTPVASDPKLRALFEDLEVVLAQVVRLPDNTSSMEVDLLTQTLERRDMLPRLRNAVADHIAD
jgi:hypothetical protein